MARHKKGRFKAKKKKRKQAADSGTWCTLKLNGHVTWGIRQIKAGWFHPLSSGCT